MPKDNENIPLLDIDSLTPSESKRFSPEEMVQCEKCLRQNAPTRVSCLYCGAALIVAEQAAERQQPTLRPLEKWELGFNNILLPQHQSGHSINEAASVVKISAEDFQRILDQQTPLPLARAATSTEATLIATRLEELGFRSMIVSDEDLGIEQHPTIRVRAAEIDEGGFWAHQIGSEESVYVDWHEVSLLVRGRLLTRSVELIEQKAGRKENRILDASELYADEPVVDLYLSGSNSNLRIAANSFDFSFLGSAKGLLANENFERVIALLKERANPVVDDLYQTVRLLLESVWAPEKESSSRGWRRDRPGKVTLESVTRTTNEKQFTRYSRLRHHLLKVGPTV